LYAGLIEAIMIEPILIVAIAIGCTVWYMQHRRRRRARALAMQYTSGLEMLAKRYARGDIDRDEYLQMKADILADRAAAGRPTVPQSRAA
jgi:uncharacterized membrane protein